MIDLSSMKGIHVDVRGRMVRAQGGVLWKELNRETQLHGLATTGGVVGSTGIAGLTLGGGRRWLMPKYGLALDNLRAADMVLAHGRVVRAAADENRDLFWAIRGGGGNFGLAASLECDLHAVGPTITGGVVVHPLSQPAIDLMGTMPYIALDSMLAPAFPTAARTACRTLVLTEMSDDAIRTLIRAFARCPSPMSRIMIEHVHGAATRVPVTATACSTTRCTGFNVVVASQWMDTGESERGVRWARETCASLAPYAARRYDGTCAEDNDSDPVQSAYGQTSHGYGRSRPGTIPAISSGRT